MGDVAIFPSPSPRSPGFVAAALPLDSAGALLSAITCPLIEKERRVGGDAFRWGGGHRLDGAPAAEPIVQPIGIRVAPVCPEDPSVGGGNAHQRHQEK